MRASSVSSTNPSPARNNRYTMQKPWEHICFFARSTSSVPGGGAKSYTHVWVRRLEVTPYLYKNNCQVTGCARSKHWQKRMHKVWKWRGTWQSLQVQTMVANSCTWSWKTVYSALSQNNKPEICGKPKQRLGSVALNFWIRHYRVCSDASTRQRLSLRNIYAQRATVSSGFFFSVTGYCL